MIARLGELQAMQPLMALLARLLAPRHRIAVFVVVEDGDERVLLLRHLLHPVFPWGLPGGWLGGNESPQEGAIRELEEETGLRAEIGPVVYLSREKEPWHTMIVFLAKARPGPVCLGSEIVDFGWFAPDALPEGVVPFAKEAVQAARQGRQR
ncbi:MAG: NUDIX hydrolase [Acidobacteriota bacterium]